MADFSFPKTLIKYYECNTHNCDALINNYLWAAHPKQFNDPFDCAMEAWNKSSFSDSVFKKIIHPDFYKNLGHILSRNPRNHYLMFMHLFTGIICLNEYVEKNEDLLWGYYNQQTGFSLEFDTNLLSRSLGREPLDVRYRDPSSFQIFQIPKQIQFANELFPILTDWIRQKKRIWENESEWRYIFFDCNYNPCPEYGLIETRKKRYALTSIKRIILGFKFFDGCFLEKTGNGFKYDISEEKDKINILEYIKQNQIPLAWINLFNLKLMKVPIEIDSVDCKSISFRYME